MYKKAKTFFGIQTACPQTQKQIRIALAAEQKLPGKTIQLFAAVSFADCLRKLTKKAMKILSKTLVG